MLRRRLLGQLRATRSDPSLRREADMMAFYLGLTLLVALNVARDQAPPPLPELLLIVWGTTVGLAVAHWFALTLSAALVKDPNLHHTPAQMLFGQLVMAVVLALVASVGVLVASVRAEEIVSARVAVALFIGVLVAVEARASGLGLLRALLLGAAGLAVALAIATLKLVLT